MGSIIALPNDYSVIDLETTGLDYMWDSIIEIAAIKVRGGIIVDHYNQLISPGFEIPGFITDLTGITNSMLEDSPQIQDVIGNFASFIGDDLLIGHNVNFDIRFLEREFHDHLNIKLMNFYVDTMRLSRRVIPGLKHHRLCDLAEYFHIPHTNAHRAGADCAITNDCYRHIREQILSNESEESFQNRCKKHNINVKDIKATTEIFDTDHPLYQKTVVFTGALSKMSRAEAMQIVVNCGGICGSGVTTKTNYLVIGTSDYISATEGKKTSKMIKADKLFAEGQDIATISEQTFLDFISYK